MSVKNRRNTATIVNKSRKVAKTPIRVSHSNSSKNSVRQNARWKYLNYSAFVNVRIRGLDNPLRSALSNVYGRKTELHSTRAGARALQELSTRAWYSGPLPRGCDRVLVGLLRGCGRVLFPRHACTSLGMRSSRTLNLEITDPRRIRSSM